jgi:hypothetical protein
VINTSYKTASYHRFIDLIIFNMVQDKDKVEIRVASNDDGAKSVSFSGKARVKSTLALGQYSDTEFRACWYSNVEYNMIQIEMNYTIRKMEKKSHFDDGKFCTRGLESRTKEGSKRRLCIMQEGICMVLDEQYEQLESGVKNEHTIADVYQTFGHDCTVSSYLRGVSDQHIARQDDGVKNIKDAIEASTGNLNGMQRRRRKLSRQLSLFFSPSA